MSYRVDYKEPIAHVIGRLQEDHKELEPKLDRILELCNEGNLKVASSLLLSLRTEILRHAVEEEALVVREIMKYAKEESGESVSIFQQHRQILHFLNDVLPNTTKQLTPSAVEELRKFIELFRKHHIGEERIAFPLALNVRKPHEEN